MCAVLLDARGPDLTISARLLRLGRAGLTRCMPRRPAGEPARHFRAVIFKVDRIGDFVLALGAIRVALHAWGESSCLLVVSALSEPLAAEEFPRTPRLVLPPFVGHGQIFSATRVARRALSTISCDIAINLRHQRWDFDELCLSWVRAKSIHVVEDVAGRWMFAERRSFSAPQAKRMTFEEEALAPADDGWQLSRELAMHRQLLSVVLERSISADEILPRLMRERAGTFGPVVVSPLGSHPLRDLFPDGLLLALKKVQAAGLSSVLVGTARQRLRLEEIAGALRAQRLQHVDVRSDLSLSDFVRALGAAPLVLTTESAAAHLATALDRPTVVVLGGGHFGQFGPWRRSRRQAWLTNEMECFSCNWRCIHPQPYCVTRVPAQAIASAVAERLPQEGAR
jgi:ADP-heptose:LPS heptosyltransferase